MFSFPKTQEQWFIAVASALAGFFFGGAAIAYTQRFLKRWFGIG